MTEESDIRYFEQMDQQPPLVLFDGCCNLCDWSVRFLIRYEKHEVLRFASVESQIGRAVLRRFGLPISDLESFVLIEGGHYHTKSAALFQVVRYLGPPWQILMGRAKSISTIWQEALVRDYLFRNIKALFALIPMLI
jgi:predicted DCC family thiol-disulfide oxidoreductase YuxK